MRLIKEGSMELSQVVRMIPEESEDEALRAIGAIILFPARREARVRCHLAQPFHLWIAVRGEVITITVEDFLAEDCGVDTFLATLRRCIYEEDEAIANGTYTPRRRRSTRTDFHRPAPPAHMDLPVWDEATGRWYDAEY
jgi:hypothetical protein